MIRGGCEVAAFFMAVALIAVAETVVEVPLIPPPFDKAVHLTYYGIIAALLARDLGISLRESPLHQYVERYALLWPRRNRR